MIPHPYPIIAGIRSYRCGKSKTGFNMVPRATTAALDRNAKREPHLDYTTAGMPHTAAHQGMTSSESCPRGATTIHQKVMFAAND